LCNQALTILIAGEGRQCKTICTWFKRACQAERDYPESHAFRNIPEEKRRELQRQCIDHPRAKHTDVYHEILSTLDHSTPNPKLIAHFISLSNAMCVRPEDMAMIGMRAGQILFLSRFKDFRPDGTQGHPTGVHIMPYLQLSEKIHATAQQEGLDPTQIQFIQILSHLGFIHSFKSRKAPHEQSLADASQRWFAQFAYHSRLTPEELWSFVGHTGGILYHVEGVPYVRPLFDLLNGYLSSQVDLKRDPDCPSLLKQIRACSAKLDFTTH
jgi:hypothetical protein